MKIYWILFVFTWSTISAQNWVPLTTGLDYDARVLYADSVSGKLFVGGNFRHAGGMNANVIAAWDGNAWDTLAGGMGDPNPVQTIKRFQNRLYVGGNFTKAGGRTVNGFTSWNGTGWDSINIAFHDGIVAGFYEHNNLLYCMGDFDSTGSAHSPLVAAWDGANWIPIGLPHAVGGGYTIGSCIEFQNELYFAGNFTDSASVLFDFVKWDGTNWYKAGGNFGGFISSMVIYNNEMYISATGPLSNSPGQYIVKFDGTNFYSVGGGINDLVYNLKVIGNKLFAVGVFTQAGSTPASCIAMWDGNTWSALSADTFNNAIEDLEMFNNELYVTGGFNKINSDTFSYIAKYIGVLPNGVEELSSQNNIGFYPNPSTGVYHLQGNNKEFSLVSVRIYDALGKLVKQYDLSMRTGSYKVDIDLRNEPNGIYAINVITDNSSLVAKIIKQN
jgi:hypothetical protein